MSQRSLSAEMATWALNAPVNNRLLFFIITGEFIRFFNLTSGLNFGEYYTLFTLLVFAGHIPKICEDTTVDKQ